MDCFLFEGHKVLFRVALANLKLFYKSVSSKRELYQSAKKDGLYPTFSSHSKNIAPAELLRVAFKFPRFSKADIAKLTAKLDMEARANRLKRSGRRRQARSSEDLADQGRKAPAAFSPPQHRPSGAYPIHHLVSEILSKEQVSIELHKPHIIKQSNPQILSIWDELPDRIVSIKPTLGEDHFEKTFSIH